MILQVLFWGWGYNVVLVYSGYDVLVQVCEKVFDLVLCDVCMVEMDGIVMLKEIKVFNFVILILIMMVFFSVEMVVEVLKVGVFDYLIKLLDFDCLQEMLEKVLVYMWEMGVELLLVLVVQFGMIGSSLVM